MKDTTLGSIGKEKVWGERGEVGREEGAGT